MSPSGRMRRTRPGEPVPTSLGGFCVFCLERTTNMRKFGQHFVNFLKREDGPTAVEYAVMLALIIVVCLTAITTLGSNANSTFTSVGTRSSAPKRGRRPESSRPRARPGRRRPRSVALRGSPSVVWVLAGQDSNPDLERSRWGWSSERQPKRVTMSLFTLFQLAAAVHLWRHDRLGSHRLVEVQGLPTGSLSRSS